MSLLALKSLVLSKGVAVALGVSLVGGGIVSLGISSALFTAQTSNPSTSAATGTLKMTNSKTGAAIFTLTNLKPGDTGSGTVLITNSGTLPGTYSVTQSAVALGGTGTGDLGAQLTLTVTGPGTTPVYTGAFNAFGTVALGTFTAGQATTYTFTVTLPSTADNTFQDRSVSATFTWNATQ